MSLRDEIRWEAQLPADYPSGGNRLFRTGSFGMACWDHYVVTAEGRLLLVGNGWRDDPEFTDISGRSPVDVEYHGDIELSSDQGDHHYVARFTHGTLESIRPLADDEPWSLTGIAYMKFTKEDRSV